VADSRIGSITPAYGIARFTVLNGGCPGEDLKNESAYGGFPERIAIIPILQTAGH